MAGLALLPIPVSHACVYSFASLGTAGSSRRRLSGLRIGYFARDAAASACCLRLHKLPLLRHAALVCVCYKPARAFQ